MKIAFLLVLSTVLVGLVRTSPYRKESLLEALMNKIEEKEQAEAEQLQRWDWPHLSNKIEEREQAEAEQLQRWDWPHLSNKIEEREQAEAESIDAQMQKASILAIMQTQQLQLSKI